MREAVGICIDECGANKKYLKFIWLILAEFLCDYVIKLYSCVWMRLAVSEVILIGDRAVGKTQSVMELIVSTPEKLSIMNIKREDVVSLRQGANPSAKPLATSTINHQPLEMAAKLSASRRLKVNWIDTPGEWNQKEWQDDNNKAHLFDKYKTTLQNATAVNLLLRPFRNAGGAKIKDKKLIEEHWISTETQWCHRFERWVDFLNTSCPNMRYINFCLNKADLLCTTPMQLKMEASKLSGLGWQDRSDYVYGKYFCSSNEVFVRSIQSVRAASVKFFITSTASRTLLELPWLYLATYL